MMRVFQPEPSNFLLASLFFCFFTCSFGQERQWRPIDPEDLRSKVSSLEADADAEVLLWEVRIADDYVSRAGFKTVLDHYLRIKIYNERGRDRFAKTEIPFGKLKDLGVNVTIKDIAAHTIKPDGSTIDVKPSDIFDQNTVSAKGIKLRAKTFVFPGIGPGAIIEYRWKEIRSDAISNYIRLQLAREIPVRYVKYYVRPVTAPFFTLGMRVHSINTQSNFVKEADGFYSTTMTNVPSFKDEPFMPPADEIQPWVLVYYADDRDRQITADEYWKLIGKRTYELHSKELKSLGNVTATAASITTGTVDPNEKIRRIFDFVRVNIKNIEDDASGISTEALKEIKPNKNVSETLDRKRGTWHDINMLFAALVRAVGIDVRVANVSLRTDTKLDKSLTNDYFIRTEVIAVKLDNGWSFFDPGTSYVPFGMVYWSEEGQSALVSDPTEPEWTVIPVSKADDTVRRRTGDLKILPDGTLEGIINLEFSGHLGAKKRETIDDLSFNEREKDLIALMKSSVNDSIEISQLSIDGLADASKPLTYRFHIRVPNYAELTGKWAFVRPNLFERGTQSRFSSSTRINDLFFDYPWTEIDEVDIEIPSEWQLETTVVSPTAVDPRKVGTYQSSIDSNGRSLSYRRKFAYGLGGQVSGGAGSYDRIKQFFDDVHKADGFSVTFRSSK